MNPLKKEPSIIDELNKPSKGEEVIKKIKISKVPQENLKKLLAPSKGNKLIEKIEKKEYLTNIDDGVEVLDVKAIENIK